MGRADILYNVHCEHQVRSPCVLLAAVLRQDENDNMGHGGSMYCLVCCDCKTFHALLELQVLILGCR
jgi:hypothetical protein